MMISLGYNGDETDVSESEVTVRQVKWSRAEKQKQK